MANFYDYIIVGGGTAGLVLANRLSQHQNVTVLVLEAGVDKDEDPRVKIPGMWRANAGTEHDWAFETVPQVHLNGRTIPYLQGKLLGGSSSINVQAIIPPSKSDLDAWEAIGNVGWNWETLEPYLTGFFKLQAPSAETIASLNVEWSRELWSTAEPSSLGNPIEASFANANGESALADAWIQAFEQLGYPLERNPMKGVSIGPFNGLASVDVVTKARASSSTAYYKPIQARENLHVLTNCTVGKVLFRKTSDGLNIATGVQYSCANRSETANAAKEVIICAGTFQSPKLLELSGIGDPEVLIQHGIDVHVINPFIGQNLQEHVLQAVSFEVRDKVLPTRDALLRRDPDAIKAAIEGYASAQTGPFTSSSISSFAYLPVDDYKHDTEARDSFIEALSKVDAGHPLDRHRVSLLRDLVQQGNEGTVQYFTFAAQGSLAGETVKESDFISICASLSHPLSSGTVHISSTDPLLRPIIDFRYFSNHLDMELAARQVRFIEKIAAAGPMMKLLKPDGLRNHPTAYIGDDLAKAKEFVKVASIMNYHPCGTCAMAPKDLGGVVDTRLRVYGTRNLRVVDASVFPFIPQSNLQSLVYAVAERAADIIKDDM